MHVRDFIQEQSMVFELQCFCLNRAITFFGLPDISSSRLKVNELTMFCFFAVLVNSPKFEEN